MRLHAWTDLEMELIRETAERIWVAVEKARTEIAARESIERQGFLLAFSDALRAEPGADAIADRAIRMLSEQLQLDCCYLASYRLADDHADITHQAGNGRLPPMPETIRLSDFPEAFRAVFDRTLVIDDVSADESLSPTDRDNILGLGMRALMAPTLRKGPHRPLWVVVAVSVLPRRWTQGEITLAEEVAERTWVAVERARAEAALRESEERFQQFAKASAAGLWVRDAGVMDMEFVSPAVGAIYGVEPEALLGDVKHWAAMIVPEDRDEALKHLEAARDGATAVHEFRIQRPSDGAFRWITTVPSHGVAPLHLPRGLNHRAAPAQEEPGCFAAWHTILDRSPPLPAGSCGNASGASRDASLLPCVTTGAPQYSRPPDHVSFAGPGEWRPLRVGACGSRHRRD